IYDFDFLILGSNHLIESVSLSIFGSIPDTVIYLNGHQYFGFGFRVKFSSRLEFQIRSYRYYLNLCGHICGLALFKNYAKIDYQCIQVGSELYYLNLEYFDANFDTSRIILMESLTSYFSQESDPFILVKTFMTRTCSKEEIVGQKIKSNPTIAVTNFEDQRTSIYFVDVSKKRIGPYFTTRIIKNNKTYFEVKNKYFKLTGFTILNLESLLLEKYGRLLNNISAIFMAQQNSTRISCSIGDGVINYYTHNKICDVVVSQHGNIIL
ncbi:hypothetical protein HZS_615, partial [Henneguya salminicola]